jgi:hypothetical protein
MVADNPLHLVPDSKFSAAMLCTRNSFRGEELLLGPHLSVHKRLPGSLLDMWKEDLGRFQCNRLMESGVLLVVQKPALQPDVLDGEFDELDDRIRRLIFCLFANGIRLWGHDIIFLKGHNTQQTWIQQLNFYGSFYYHKKVPYAPVTEDLLLTLESQANLLMSALSTGSYRRFARGTRALMNGLMESEIPERTFHFVRAIDALIASGRREGKESFVEYASKLTSSGSSYEELFRQAYKIRSCIAHAIPLEQAKRPDESDRIAHDRWVGVAGELEIIALEAYRRILADSTLLSNYDTEAHIRAHRNAAWDPAIDLESIRKARKNAIRSMRRSIIAGD